MHLPDKMSYNTQASVMGIASQTITLITSTTTIASDTNTQQQWPLILLNIMAKIQAPLGPHARLELVQLCTQPHPAPQTALKAHL